MFLFLFFKRAMHLKKAHAVVSWFPMYVQTEVLKLINYLMFSWLFQADQINHI